MCFHSCGPNPYMALLHRADLIAVTADSVGMASEACCAGRPVLTIAEHRCKGKIRKFHEALRQVSETLPEMLLCQ